MNVPRNKAVKRERGDMNQIEETGNLGRLFPKRSKKNVVG
jgi:hypothetical protein